MPRRRREDFESIAIPNVVRVSQKAFYQDVMSGGEEDVATIEANPESWTPVVEGVATMANGFGDILKSLEEAQVRDGRMANSHELYLLEQMVSRALTERFPEAMFEHERKLEAAQRALFDLLKSTLESQQQQGRAKHYERWATELVVKRRTGFASLFARAEAAGESGLVIERPDQLTQDERLVFQDPRGFHGSSNFAWPQLGRVAMFVVKAVHGSLYAEELPILYNEHGVRERLSEAEKDQRVVYWNLPREVHVHERIKQQAAWDALVQRLTAGEEIWYKDKDNIPPSELAAFLNDDFTERDAFLSFVDAEHPAKLWLNNGELSVVMYLKDDGKLRLDNIYACPRP